MNNRQNNSNNQEIEVHSVIYIDDQQDKIMARNSYVDLDDDDANDDGDECNGYNDDI